MRPGRAKLFGAASLCAAAACLPAYAAEKQYTYAIDVPSHGDVGTYKFVFDSEGNAMRITADGHVKVTALGVALYTRDASGQERWAKDRLEEFHGVTTINGKARTVEGWIEGDHFVIRTEAGETIAPLDIRPISPWTTSTPGDSTMFVAGTGAVKQVHVDPGQDTTLTIEGADVPVRSFQGQTTDGENRFQVFIDASGTPVKFIDHEPDTDATLTLVR